MYIRRYIVLLFLSLLLSDFSYAFEVVVSDKPSERTATCHNITYPEIQVIQELESGLANYFVAVLQMETPEEKKFLKIERRVKFDLWQESFSVLSKHGKQLRKQLNLPAPETIATISSFKFDLPAAINMLSGTVKFSCFIAFNPVTKEQKEKIRAWISRGRSRVGRGVGDGRNDTRSVDAKSKLNLSSSNSAANVDRNGTQFPSLFDKILSTKLNGVDFSAEWTSDVVFTTATFQNK